MGVFCLWNRNTVSVVNTCNSYFWRETLNRMKLQITCDFYAARYIYSLLSLKEIWMKRCYKYVKRGMILRQTNIITFRTFIRIVLHVWISTLTVFLYMERKWNSFQNTPECIISMNQWQMVDISHCHPIQTLSWDRIVLALFCKPFDILISIFSFLQLYLYSQIIHNSKECLECLTQSFPQKLQYMCYDSALH